MNLSFRTKLFLASLGLIAASIIPANAYLTRRLDADQMRRIRADMFGSLEDVRGEFGTVVIDPPKIAARRSDLDRAIPALSRLVQRLAPRVADGGHLVLCSCSHHLVREHLDRVVTTLPGADAGAWPRVHALGAGFDHPTMPAHREGEYLRVNVHQRRG